MSFDPEPAAEALIANRAARRPAGPLPEAIRPQTVADGSAVQAAVARRVGAMPPGGFKIGATGSRMQAVLNLSGPAAGFIRAEDIYQSGATVRFADFHQVKTECEILVTLGADLPPQPCTIAQAEAAIASVHAGIEIVENRYGPPPIGDLAAVGTPTLIADQVYHAACVIGASAENWRAIDLAAIEGSIAIDGIVRDQGQGSDLLGHPLRGLAWLASSETAAAFGGLRAGQVIMLGSVTPSVEIAAPCLVEVRFDRLPAVSVRFA